VRFLGVEGQHHVAGADLLDRPLGAVGHQDRRPRGKAQAAVLRPGIDSHGRVGSGVEEAEQQRVAPDPGLARGLVLGDREQLAEIPVDLAVLLDATRLAIRPSATAVRRPLPDR
jgi:hypothetical protein